MTNTFVFDLDSTVVEPITYDEERLFHEIDEVLGKDFRKDMSVKIMGYTHIIFPGFYPLFRWIHERGDNLFFFSTGEEHRNAELVPELIKRAFGKNYEEVLLKVKIFSCDDCIDTRFMWEDKNRYQPLSFYGQRKKKLENIVVSSQELKNTLLIDDDPSYMTKGEEKNFLYVPSVHGYFSSYHASDNYQFYSFHKAFYIRGVLEKILKIAQECGVSLSEASWSLIDDELKPEVYLKKGKPFSDRPRYLHKINDPLVYDDGLELLKIFDPDLNYLFEI